MGTRAAGECFHSVLKLMVNSVFSKCKFSLLAPSLREQHVLVLSPSSSVSVTRFLSRFKMAGNSFSTFQDLEFDGSL